MTILSTTYNLQQGRLFMQLFMTCVKAFKASYRDSAGNNQYSS